MKGKLATVREKGYIQPGHVESLTGYFAVPKGTSDIRMVYDATRSGLNAALWTPSFALPTADDLTDLISSDSWLMDLDMGEMFLNFPLGKNLRAHCGVDLRPYLGTPGQKETLWERWERCVMAMKPSGYWSTKYVHLADEWVYGNRHNPANPLAWDSVRINLPGTAEYDPRKSWFSRVTVTNELVGWLTKYIDDLRPVGNSNEHCWQVGHTVASRYGYLGIQVSTRKTRPPSQDPGAWAGILVSTGPRGIGVRCSLEKWLKAKQQLRELADTLRRPGVHVDYKRLEQQRGFLIHLMRTYPCITPFIKGFHLTLDGWRAGRNSDGWKEQGSPGEDGFWDDDKGEWVAHDKFLHHPSAVRPVPRLVSDVHCLLQLFQHDQPAVRLVRPTSIAVVVYGFGDASKGGFGSTLGRLDGTTTFRYGTWGRDGDSVSSNFRELANLVHTVEAGVADGSLQGTELFLFTDNQTAEGAYYKGNTDSETLFQLVLRLRLLDMTGHLRLHIIHVAGSRMINQGTDGLSRGDYTTGVMAGHDFLTFVPLHVPALTGHPPLLDWVRSWTDSPDLAPLSYCDWFSTGHGLEDVPRDPAGSWEPRLNSRTLFLWAPPPALASTALNELLLSRHKRTQLTHVFLCPRLFTHAWRRKLHKVADIVLELPAGLHPEWPSAMHEPLLIGLTLPFLSFCPWELRNTKHLLDLGREVCRMWRLPEGDVRPLLRQLLHSSTYLESLPADVVRAMLSPAPT